MIMDSLDISYGRIKTSCRACGNKLDKVLINHYSFCSFCDSANYISNRSAEDDNRDYFNSFYSNASYSRIVEKRFKLFRLGEYIYSKMHEKENARFNLFLKNISEMMIRTGRVIEIGFGTGDEMVKLLKAGANIYGVDQSETAVQKFKLNYPEFGSRVGCSAVVDSSVDIVYSNALFEHLDQPDDFLTNVFEMLNPEGVLIMKMPLITGVLTKGRADSDINFWKPCHRVLYTFKGINILLERNGFRISESAPFHYYGYNVMTRMIQLGYREIIHIRNPYVSIENLKSDFIYNLILTQSLFQRGVCSDFALIASKIK